MIGTAADRLIAEFPLRNRVPGSTPPASIRIQLAEQPSRWRVMSEVISRLISAPRQHRSPPRPADRKAECQRDSNNEVRTDHALTWGTSASARHSGASSRRRSEPKAFVAFSVFRRRGSAVTRSAPRGARQNPMKPAGEVCKDGCSASLHGQEPGFAVTKLGAEADARSRAHREEEQRMATGKV